MLISTGELIDYLRKSSKAQQTIAKLIKSIEKLETNAVDNAHEIGKALRKIQEPFAVLPDSEAKTMIDRWKSELADNLEAYVVENKRTFGINLESLLKEKGLQLSGNYPLLKAGIYTIELDFDKAVALIWYGPKEELMARSKLSTNAIAKQLEQVDESLTKRTLDVSSFLKNLNNAYKTVILRRGGKQGDHIPILNVLMEYVFSHQNKSFVIDPKKDNFKEYGRAYFSYDLYKVGKGIVFNQELLLVPATRATAVKRESYLWVPSDTDGNGDRCAYLFFRNVA